MMLYPAHLCRAFCLTVFLCVLTITGSTGASAVSEDCQRNVKCTVGSVMALLSKPDADAVKERHLLPAYGYVGMALSMSGAPNATVKEFYQQVRTAIAGMDSIPNSIDQMIAFMIIHDFVSSPRPEALNTVAREFRAEIIRRNDQMRRYGTLSPLCKANDYLLSGAIGYDPAMRNRVLEATPGLPECHARLNRIFAEQDARSGRAFDKVFMADGDGFTARNRNYRHYRNLAIAFGGRDESRTKAIVRAWIAVTKRRVQKGRERSVNVVSNVLYLHRLGYEREAAEMLALVDVEDLRDTGFSRSFELYLSASLMDVREARDLLRPNIEAELSEKRPGGFETVRKRDHLRRLAARLLLAIDLDKAAWK